MALIPTLADHVILDGWDHVGLLNNDPLYMSTLFSKVPLASIPVSDPLICPIVVPNSTCELEVVFEEEPVDEECTKSSKSKCKSKSGSGSSRRRELSSSKSKSKSKKKKKSKKDKGPEPTFVFVGECTETEMRELVE